MASDGRGLDGRKVQIMNSNDSDDYRERLNAAAATYLEREIADRPDLESDKLTRLLLEKAFIEGASWYNLVVQQRMTAQLTEFKSELKEVLSRAH